MAVAVTPHTGTTIVVITQAVVASCPALSRIGSDTYVATIGNGMLVDHDKSLAADARWARARHYLERDPIAIAFRGDTRDALAVAQPDPVAAWIAIDAVDLDAIERDVRAMFDRWRSSKLVPQIDRLITKLDIKRDGHQLIVRASHLDADDLSAIVGELLRAADSRSPVAVAVGSSNASAVFTCPPIGHGITACKDGTRYTVSSVANTVGMLATVASTPLIENGDVVGIRLTADAPAPLRRDDVILGLDSQRITNSSQLRELARHVGDHAVLAVRRGVAEGALELRE